jgi:hypothetical protein
MGLHKIKKLSHNKHKWSLNWRDHTQSGRKHLPVIHQTKNW